MYAILLAGLPAAGKSHMARKLSGLLGLPVFSKDDIKERLYDTVGFHSRAEKVALGVGAMEILYYTAGQVMGQGGSVIIENNFENASVPGLRALLEKHRAQPITVMLTGDYQIIYQRFLLRDQSPQRHRGHIVNTCYPEPEGAKALYQPMSLEQFVAGFTSRGMAGFDIGGPRITVDVTEVGRIDYQQLAGEIKALMTS
ncbi:AAA family ATPase [Acutalibacter caecimuris]|uniref:AAA family ATPase n=1 Tax=Acutalibacter caecimuris TaxID=3093657 RepID=UPI002AC94B78|nr:AAA family ATPase [Acutalibacter sp. M00118]